MIWQALVDLFVFFIDSTLGTVMGLLPEPVPWVADGFDALGTLWSYLAQLDSWIPVSLAMTVVTAVVGMYLITWAIGLVKVVLSYLTFGGGVS